MNKILLCTDLDRTLIPNGQEPETNQAGKKFRALARHNQVTLVYVTGRHQSLIEQAIEDYQLPQPKFVIADVGSSVYAVRNHEWHYQTNCKNIINQDWQNKATDELHGLLAHIKNIQRQETSKQNTHKLSYYVPLDTDHQRIISAIKQQLEQYSIHANLIWSIDQQADIGLLDILPASAGKREAIEFLMQQLDFNYSDTVFAGDSRNDVCVMSSPIQSILATNATESVRKDAIHQAQLSNQEDTLYLAQSHFMDMNSHYSAGIL